ncbi:hypothetical protein SDC9_86844 [bioreactor metagenome]|uniref:Uncharacterized protein n=1 Tax=bioreactor metagenome TaxID=1076179 RepID=A0A644ZRH1_9ZZZZ
MVRIELDDARCDHVKEVLDHWFRSGHLRFLFSNFRHEKTSCLAEGGSMPFGRKVSPYGRRMILLILRELPSVPRRNPHMLLW